MEKFQDKVVVITGAGSGIGRELAMQFAAKGAILALNDWKNEPLLETWESLPEKARGYKEVFDVGDRTKVENFATKVHKTLGQVDVVINNAGMSIPQNPIIYSEVEDYERVLQVNLWGVIYGSLTFLPYLRERKGGYLVNVSSVFGLMGFPGSAPYNVSKFGVRGFTETLRVEMRSTGLNVVCVHPGGIRTNIARNIEFTDAKERERFVKNFDKQAPTTAAQAATTIIRGMEKGRNRITIGRDASFIDKITRLMPETYEKILARWLKPERFLAERKPTKSPAGETTD
ncbi:MAG: SDR family oxidoreductase [Bacteroidota bacterium]